MTIRYRNLTAALLTSLLLGCTSVKQFQAMTPQDRAEYVAFAQQMTVDQRKEYLARGSSEKRADYLKEIGLYDRFFEQTAFTRLEEEKRTDFLKAYMNATPQQIRQFLSVYDAETRDRILSKDLQHGWSSEQVILALGKPADILEAASAKGVNQLWIYDREDVATYVYFKDGALSNWAK